jgi:hypothetical protein
VSDDEKKGHIVDVDRLPAKYPTHLHSKDFWEALGRCVATFGFLEEILGRAIFAFTATREYRDDEVEGAYREWLPTLESALSDQLGRLISTYDKVVRDHGKAEIPGFGALLDDLRQASTIRNVLCHGSWRTPDEHGRSRPFFVNKKHEIFDVDIDLEYLEKVQHCVSVLSGIIVSTVTQMGWQFPGSQGPGVPILKTLNSKERKG